MTVIGTVQDEKGEPLPGAVVMPKDETKINGTITDVNGNFVLTGVSSTRSTYLLPGYETEVPIEGKAIISVALQPGAQMLQELVVTGYQSIVESDRCCLTVNAEALQERYTPTSCRTWRVVLLDW